MAQGHFLDEYSPSQKLEMGITPYFREHFQETTINKLLVRKPYNLPMGIGTPGMQRKKKKQISLCPCKGVEESPTKSVETWLNLYFTPQKQHAIFYLVFFTIFYVSYYSIVTNFQN